MAGRGWAWALFVAVVPLPAGAKGGKVELVCKAVDESYNTQARRGQRASLRGGVMLLGWVWLRLCKRRLHVRGCRRDVMYAVLMLLTYLTCFPPPS